MIILLINVRMKSRHNKLYKIIQRIILMRKQIDGQLNLFDYISEEEKFDFDKQSHSEKNQKNASNDGQFIFFFKECSLCWCSTCRHNKKGQAIPRDFAGEKKPCPSCDFCIKNKKVEICEIGSYENGCKLRAEEEGIMIT